MTYSYTNSQSFTLTNAKYLASKVAADLKRIQRFYGSPPDNWIRDYEEEVTNLLRHGYLGTITYGFQRDGKWISPTLIYTAQDLVGVFSDDDPGHIPINADVKDAEFNSYLTYSSSWDKLLKEEKNEFKKVLPFQRIEANEPGIDGYILRDHTYSSGGKSLNRSIIKK